MQTLSSEERALNIALRDLPELHGNRYTHAAKCELRQILFRSIARHRDDYLRLLFPNGPPTDRSEEWCLKSAQGAIDGAEYTAAAKGTACGHIFKTGESTYHCKTCAADDTCVLCARCFNASDHEGHQVFVSVSPGNSGCCDCGDHEAWRREVPCTIHTADAAPQPQQQQHNGKEKASAGGVGSDLPVDLVEAIRMTVARTIDYLCDVFSCSPEQMRLTKTEASIRKDEEESRLSTIYGDEVVPDQIEYALLLWNDEKHTVYDVQNQVARACSRTKKFGLEKAMEVDSVGRSVIEYSTDLRLLLRMAEVIEQLKVTVTIRSSRDTFREYMCETIVDWIGDIAGCSVGTDAHILRNVVCEEMLKPWRKGSQASNADIGKAGIDDHEMEDNAKSRERWRRFIQPFRVGPDTVDAIVFQATAPLDEDDIAVELAANDDDDEMMIMEDDEMDVEVEDLRGAANTAMAATVAAVNDADMEIDILDETEDVTEAFEATLAGYPTPPPPPTGTTRRTRSTRQIFTPTESEEGGDAPSAVLHNVTDAPYGTIPRTPSKFRSQVRKPPKPSKHWLEKPEGFRDTKPIEPCEDLWQRVKLDYLILYDLRLWKTLRIHLRHLYITTVVTIPRFKRILGLRFAGLYTALAQLYLIADREPDHSIINLSVQMLTTPSITQEVVERGNFLSNLMAILYTFLTTRQVGFPEDVSPRATLAFDAGAVTNRRMFHFFLDLRWLFQSDFILSRIRNEQRYLLQFLDLVKLHQGVCPNVRATSEHVEYESDAWITASMIVKEINKLCKQVGLAFEPQSGALDGNMHLQRAIRTVAQVVLINSYGCERKRFHAAEVKEELTWHAVGPFDHTDKIFKVPRSVVQTTPLSFHHPLHYLLSWLIEHAKGMSRQELRSLLQFTPDDLKDPWNINRPQTLPYHVSSDELLSAIFDHSLRVCVWLGQMKAGMWVRNGITLRHQAHTYRNVSHRDVGYQRDLHMVQAGFVLSGSDSERPGERFLAQVIDRFQLEKWMQEDYSVVPGFDELQQIDVLEDFYHLLVVTLSERGNLVPNAKGLDQNDKLLEHDIAHALCFKPLPFSDIAARVTEKVSESDNFNRVLETMTTYRAPEGMSDTGTFELKPEFIELVDPYYAHFTRNHREEAESIYKKHVASKSGKKAEDIVYEPSLQPITSGLFEHLAAFTSTPLFVQVIASALNFAGSARSSSTKLQSTRIETFLHMVLHLVVIATIEDTEHGEGFVRLAALPRNGAGNQQQSVVSLLVTLSGIEDYASCHPTIRHILRKMHLRQSEVVGNALGPLGALFDRTETSSPASVSSEDKERKKQEALARQARVMAQMKQQQNSFLQNQGLVGFDDDFDDLDDMSVTGEPEDMEQKKTWSFPTGTCIWCQEETNDQRLYGTFAYLGETRILRATPVEDQDFVREVIDTPESLDRPADELRPFGVAGRNKQIVNKVAPGGKVVQSEKQGLSKGFPCDGPCFSGPVATSCGHIMHYSCFDLYLQNSLRRHQQQIARNQPDNPLLNEFICPLCKALGNTFLPIIWKAKECAHDHELHAAKSFDDWLGGLDSSYLEDLARSSHYVSNMFAPSLAATLGELSLDSPPPSQSSPHRYPVRRSSGFSRFLPWGRSEMPRMSELARSYYRVDETILKNKLWIDGHYVDGLVNPIPALSRSLALSISAFEIAHRGVGNDILARSLLSDVPELALTHFRVLSETIESYLAVSVLRPSPVNFVGRQTSVVRDRLIAALLGTQNLGSSAADDDRYDSLTEPCILFAEDTFSFFVDWLTHLAPNVAEASNVMQLCLWAEVAKVACVYTKVLRDGGAPASTVPLAPAGEAFTAAMHAILQISNDSTGLVLSDEECAMLRHIVERYTLTFLRKCMLIMYVRYGLDFDCPYEVEPEASEGARLTQLLHLPTIDELCTTYTSQSGPGNRIRQLTARWIAEPSIQYSFDRLPMLPHPAIFELVGLPKAYDTLSEEAIRRKCPTTGREITDAAICLLCGAIFCSQAVCCMRDKNKGGCYQHMSKCGGKTGLFINVRKCMVLLRHGAGNGSFVNAPFLDKHGEPDPTMRRHHQLFLNQRRYDKLIREVWLQQLIPTVISRKLEGDVNPGGWETL
ncbi:hypothetical protein BDY17DRAFT_243376 [Neohortaea acidophila]|uniref:E3 ubiquitin-protein ligase n=1 Tax=Neohortaea acidophila TaxID=245834 RepID=A0A6A6Q5F2_9PEZI|nr:uncharacterized protein BDY17DRAFT_243376 [Neohortaea acidophila]KAF2487291.1 hypothetical protein BDY17DRAFT_243376 [Neohortaea acidophila]